MNISERKTSSHWSIIKNFKSRGETVIDTHQPAKGYNAVSKAFKSHYPQMETIRNNGEPSQEKQNDPYSSSTTPKHHHANRNTVFKCVRDC